MNIKLDSYAYKARMLPVYIAISPMLLLLLALVPEAFKFQIGGAAAAFFVFLSFFLSQIGADFGKKLEKGLWHKWGGAPTTRFLRHGNSEFNEITRGLIHTKLRALGLHVPTPEEQDAAPDTADQYYGACVSEIIRHTRDVAKYPLVFKSLTEYGFRRNLLGLKCFGIPFALACFVCCSWLIYDFFIATKKVLALFYSPAVQAFLGFCSFGLVGLVKLMSAFLLIDMLVSSSKPL